MIRSEATRLRIVHALPGRLRVHLPRLSAATHAEVGRALSPLRRLAGVRRVSASPITGNVLVTYDPCRIDESRLLATLDDRSRAGTEGAAHVRASAPPIVPARAVASHPGAASRRREPQKLLRTAVGILPTLPLVRRWLARALGPTPAALLPLLPAVLGLAQAILACSGPIGWTLAALDAMQLAADVGGVLRAA
jgi:hypothetical protein